MENNFVVISPQDLRQLITDAVSVAVKQFTLPQKIPLPQSNYMTIEQAGQYLNLAKQTLYGYACNRTIPFIKKGKKLYFEREKLDNWLQEGRKQTKIEFIKNLKK